AVAPRFPNDTTPVTKGWETWYGKREQNVRHIIGNASANWRPAWRDHAFFFNVTYGWDFSIRDDEDYAPDGSCSPLCQGDTDQGVLGYISSGRHTDFVQTLNIGSAFNLPITSPISSSTRVGFNFNKH